jgi:hypothetical protein
MAHLHETPAFPYNDLFDQEIPEIVSTIIMRLLRKNCEERYQTAQSVADDLRLCLQHYQEGTQPIQFPLSLATPGDTRKVPSVPSMIVGNHSAFKTYRSLFSRTKKTGENACMVVRGYGDMGKTAFAHELLRLYPDSYTGFAEGSEDLQVLCYAVMLCYAMLVPCWCCAVLYFAVLSLSPSPPQARDYVCLTKAVEYFVERQICTKTTSEFNIWITDFTAGLSDNTRKILPLLPKLQRLVTDEESKQVQGTSSAEIVGKSPFLSPMMQPSETSSRLLQYFCELIRPFATRGAPLVLVFDDSHNADKGSLQIIHGLLAGGEVHNLVVVLLCSEATSEAGARFKTDVIAKLKTSPARFKMTTLRPLTPTDIATLLAMMTNQVVTTHPPL